MLFRSVGTGNTVTGQVPAAGSTLSKDSGRVILYTDDAEVKNTVEVPNVVGKTAEAANRMLINAGLNVSVKGASHSNESTVAAQTIPEGTMVPTGTVVEISLRDLSVTD